MSWDLILNSLCHNSFSLHPSSLVNVTILPGSVLSVVKAAKRITVSILHLLDKCINFHAHCICWGDGLLLAMVQVNARHVSRDDVRKV